MVKENVELIFRTLGRSKLNWCFDSNMMLCSQRIAEEIVNSTCDSVLVSLDGTGEIHNKLRCNPKAYDRTINSIQQLLDAGNEIKNFKTSIILNCVLLTGNESSPFHVMKLLQNTE